MELSVASLEMKNSREMMLQEMSLLGFPINDMTDEQIEQIAREIERLLLESGFTMEQVRYVLRELNPTPER